MFGIDFNELLLIAVVALVVLGPEKLPGVARTAGALVRRARTAWANVQAEVAFEIDKDELAQQWRAGAEALRGAAGQARDTLGQAKDMFGEVREGMNGGLQGLNAPPVDKSTVVSAGLARSIGELRTLAARLDAEAGAEHDALRVVAADLRAAAEKLAAGVNGNTSQPGALPAVPAATAPAAPHATQAIADDLAGLAERLRAMPAAQVAPPPADVGESGGAAHGESDP